MDSSIKNTEYQKKLQEYYSKCLISEISKILIFLVIFSVLHLTKEYIAALFFLMLLRNNGGGLHYNHYISCLFVSFFFLFAAIFLALYVIPPQPIVYISTILCAISGYFLVPVTSKNRPPATPEQIKKSKRNTVIIIAVFFVLLFVMPNNTYIYIGYWTVLLHIFQLIIAHLVKRR